MESVIKIGKDCVRIRNNTGQQKFFAKHEIFDSKGLWPMKVNWRRLTLVSRDQ